MGMTPLNATTTVTITILDENDNSPMIQNIIVFSGVHMLLPENNSVIVIPENHPPYTPVSDQLLLLLLLHIIINSSFNLMFLILMRVGMEILFIHFKATLIILLLTVSYL